MRWLMLCLGLLATMASAEAQDRLEAQSKAIEAALDRIQLEQQSVYQQFQMVQELRRSEQQQIYQSQLVYTPPATPPNYDDLQRQKDEQAARLQGYQEELDRLYARYRELEEEKRPLLDELSALARQRSQQE